MKVSITALAVGASVILCTLATLAYVGYNKLSHSLAEIGHAAKQTEEKLSDVNAKIEVKAATSKGKMPFVTLSVGPDHTLTRSVIEAELAKGLTWNILRDGNQVLGRNAQNETTYKCFKTDPGLYTVYVTAVVDGAYRVISNVVFYRIAEE